MISVCMATYNGERYLKEQVDSILNQLSISDELIVSDDGSLDNTLNILRSYNDNRIKIFKNTGRKGVVGNFENALYQAKGNYIFLADQDDVWLSNKVEVCTSLLQTYQAVVTDCLVVDMNLKIIHESYFKLYKSKKGFLKNIFRSSYLGCCTAFRRELLNVILPMPKSLFLYHDWWIGFFIDWFGKVKFIDIPCLYFRRHCNNVTATTKKSILPIHKKIYYRIQLLLFALFRLLYKNDL